MVYQWLVAAMVLLIPTIAGAATLSLLKVFREKITILVIGAFLGIAAYGTLSYALAYLFPITAGSVITELLLFLVIAIVALVKGGGRHIMQIKTDRVALAILCISLLLFTVIGSKLLIEKPDGIYTGIINAYGDIGWHGAIITTLSQGTTLPLEDPIFEGELLTYPFLVNLISATMTVIGSSLSASVNLPAIILTPFILVLMYLMVKEYAESTLAGVLACVLFLFGGATFGWVQFFADIANATVPLKDFLLALPAQDYSGVGTSTQGFHFLNPVTSLLLPQRAMLFGIPIVLSVLILLHPTHTKGKYSLIIAGVLSGLLPLFHAHACIALAAAIIALVIAYPSKQWIQFFIPALAIGIPELLFYMGGNAESGSFFRYGPFWMTGNRNHILYWIQNTGAYIPVSILGLFLKAPKSAKALAFAGGFLFIIADTFLFAPWEWDNFKLFVFWLIFILPLVTWCFAMGLKKHTLPLLSVGIVAILCIHVFAGFLDVYKLAIPTAKTWQEWDTDGIKISQAIQTLTPASQPILTAAVHNSPAILAGRTLFLGYPAHVWSHGGLPWNREKEMKEYFAGTRDTIEGLTPRYILVGPQEHSFAPNLVVRPSWKILASYGQYTLYVNN